MADNYSPLLTEEQQIKRFLDALEQAGLLEAFYEVRTAGDIEELLNYAQQKGIVPNDQSVFDLLYDHFEPYALGLKQDATTDYLKRLGFTQGTIDYLTGFTDEKDLRQRINQLNIADNKKSLFFDQILQREKDTIPFRVGRQSEQQALQERNIKTAETWEGLSNSPYLTQQEITYWKNIVRNDDNLDETDFENILINIHNTRAKEEKASLGRGIQQTGALVRAFNQAPTFDRVSEPAPQLDLSGFDSGYGEGTRLQSFIESKVPGVVDETALSRQKYYETLGAAPPLTYGDRLSQLEQESEYYKQLAKSAPTSTVVGTTRWGEGGAAKIAQQTFDRLQKQIAELNKADFAGEGDIASFMSEQQALRAKGDPTQNALKELKRTARPLYNRLPGVNTSSRLRPGLRFR